MKIVREDDYEDMAAAFQCLQIQNLYQTLKQNGLEDAASRKICEEYTRSFGVTLDQFWIESDAGKVFPVIGFTKVHPDHSPEELHLNEGGFSFSEYAGGNSVWFFEEQDPSTGPQKFGAIQEDGSPAGG